MKLFKKAEEPQPPDPVIEELKKKISVALLPPDAEEVALKELEMLGRINPSSSEYTIGLAYIQYLVSLPWSIRTGDRGARQRDAGGAVALRLEGKAVRDNHEGTHAVA